MPNVTKHPKCRVRPVSTVHSAKRRSRQSALSNNLGGGEVRIQVVMAEWADSDSGRNATILPTMR